MAPPEAGAQRTFWRRRKGRPDLRDRELVVDSNDGATPIDDVPASTGSPRISIAPIHTLRAIRVVSALGRGRSRPLLIEAENGKQFVTKLNPSAKTARRLIAEVIAGHIGNILGLRQPEMVLLQLDAGIEHAALEPEKQEELFASVGLVFGSLHLPDAFSLRRKSATVIDPDLAAEIIWFDSLVVNADRKPRNPNILVSSETVWVIDNDSAFPMHHHWAEPVRQEKYRITPALGQTWWELTDHALLPIASSVQAAGERLSRKLSAEVIESVVAQPPESWFAIGFPNGSLIEPRQTYAQFLCNRLALRNDFERDADRLRFHGTCLEH